MCKLGGYKFLEQNWSKCPKSPLKNDHFLVLALISTCPSLKSGIPTCTNHMFEMSNKKGKSENVSLETIEFGSRLNIGIFAAKIKQFPL